MAVPLRAFGLVFLHPFEDGNGRIHRHLIHQVLLPERFTQADVPFPLSAAIPCHPSGDEAALEGFFKPINGFINWPLTSAKQIAVS